MKNFFLHTGLFIIVLLSIGGCKSGADQAQTREIITFEDDHPGKRMVLTNCIVCHNPDMGIDQRIAPPMVGVQRHYLDDTDNKEAFIAEMVDFIIKPELAKSKMPGAVKRFGLMPVQSFSKKDLQLIAEYLYHADLEEPEWFKAHYAENHPDRVMNPLERGAQYAQRTKAILGSNLLGAIKREGPEGAVSFCNTRAIPLTDSMAIAQNATIQRVSDKPRNPDNKASKAEMEMIDVFKTALSSGQQPRPVVDLQGSQSFFYSPIVTNDMCMKCHGSPGESISGETIHRIRTLYPEDQAVGYEVNQVRGMWKISWYNQPIEGQEMH